MLGKGLESLIPPKKNNNNDDNNNRKTGGDFSATSQTAPTQQAAKDEPRVMNFPDTATARGSGEASATFSNNFKETSSPSSVYKKQAASKRFLDDAIFHIEVEKIKPNPFQPRKNFDEESLKELAASIREFGILQPLVVTKIDRDTATGTDVEYQLIAGERRLKAAQLLGLERVPVIVRRIDENKEHLELAIIENLQRADLDSMETARAYSRLQDEFGLTQREIAQRLGKSREVISNTLRLLDLPGEIQEGVSSKKLNESQARLLLSIDNPIVQKQLFNEILSNNLTVRQLRTRVQRVNLGEKNQAEKTETLETEAQYYEMKAFEEKLKEFLNAPVKIHKKGEGGEIIISFYSPEEIYGLFDKINLSE